MCVKPGVSPEPLQGIGFTVWFTGLSGSGKTTLARMLSFHLEALGLAFEILDGDELRTTLCRDLGFSRKDRDENVRRLGFVAGMLSRHRVAAIVAAISPYAQAREQARTASTRFLEVFVDCSLETLVARDTKRLYKRAVAGEIAHFTGVSDPYEFPTHPELHLKTDFSSKEDCLAQVRTKLEALQWLPAKQCGWFANAGDLSARRI
jgi:adenylyl-sulfate kinase